MDNKRWEERSTTTTILKQKVEYYILAAHIQTSNIPPHPKNRSIQHNKHVPCFDLQRKCSRNVIWMWCAPKLNHGNWLFSGLRKCLLFNCPQRCRNQKCQNWFSNRNCRTHFNTNIPASVETLPIEIEDNLKPATIVSTYRIIINGESEYEWSSQKMRHTTNVHFHIVECE